MDSGDQSATEAAVGAIRMHMLATTAWGQTHCRCQQDITSADFGMDYPEHIEHVAAVVLAALKLTEEWGIRYRDGKTMGRFNRQLAEQSVAENPGRTLLRRSVGPWLAVGLPVDGEAATAEHKIGAINCGCGWHPSCVKEQP